MIQKLNAAIDQTWTAADTSRKQFKAACEADRRDEEQRDQDRVARGEEPRRRYVA